MMRPMRRVRRGAISVMSKAPHPVNGARECVLGGSSTQEKRRVAHQCRPADNPQPACQSGAKLMRSSPWCVLLLSAALTACGINPVTGKKELQFVSEPQE